jgi:hypothetical protein
MNTTEIRPELAAPTLPHGAAPAAHPAPVHLAPGHLVPGNLVPGQLVPAPNKLPPVELIPRVSLRRIPATVDPIGSAASGHETELTPFRLAANSKVFGGLAQIRLHIGIIIKRLATTKLPAKLIGAVHQPDGSAAARVQVQFKPSSISAKGAETTVLTADDGSFVLDMPVGAELPETGLPLTIHGANTNANVTVPADQVATNGMVGVIALVDRLSPLPVSIIAALQALTPVLAHTAKPPAPPTPQKSHAVAIGEHGSGCAQTFAGGDKTDRFPWGLFFRIVEPQMSIATQTEEVKVGDKMHWLPVYRIGTVMPKSANGTASKYVDRIPIDQPLSVDGFREQIAGIDGAGSFTEDETVPMAASIGLGYVLRMAQQWKFLGHGLGDLIYSLPLAPGEQQQIAVFERRDTSAVQESEAFSQDETTNQQASSDTSTLATFNQAFNEMVNAGSSFNTSSSSSSAGVSFGIGPIGFGGGGGSSSSSGNSSSSLDGSRSVTAQATQATHSSAENQAAGHLSAQRTGMRLATASEDMSTTTKIITNHNHAHALTMQYWEVQRMYDVSTTIEGLTLCCLIPMQMVRFMPPGQPVQLSDPSQVDASSKVAERYKNILQHIDVLQRAVPRQFRHGLELLSRFAADPTTVVDAAGATAETVIKIEIAGNFLACERITVAAVTKRRTRVGPVQFSPSVAGQPAQIPPNTFMTQDELTAWLTVERLASRTTLQASLAVPSSVNRSDIIGFEVTRRFDNVVYPLTSAAQQAAEQFISQELHDNQPSFWQFFAEASKAGGLQPLGTVTLTPSQLEPILGGPTLDRFYAAVENFDKSGNDVPAPQETYANDSITGTVLPAAPFPIPALQIAPVLRYQDVLEIERSAQHIVRNTARYSKALWISLSPEETAILLDGYTIGVPAGGLEDASQMIPLMNCVQNVILGTFGNSLIMPFNIPQDLADQTGIDPSQLEQALLDYQRETFISPRSTIALPTRGVLGEAVLGSCPSAEKIDLTRFWNWQDAPADTAPGIGMVQLPTTTPPLTTGVTAPNSLTNLPPLINNLITAPQPNTGLLQAMGQQATSQPDFSPNFTGQQQLASLLQNGQTQANQARSDALKTSQTMASQAMNQMTQLVTAAMGGSSPASPAAKTATPSTNKTPAAAGGKTTGASQAAGAGQAAGATQGAAGAAAGDSSAAGSLASTVGDLAPLAALLA